MACGFMACGFTYAAASVPLSLGVRCRPRYLHPRLEIRAGAIVVDALCQNRFDDVTMNVGQTESPTLVPVGQPFVVDSQ